MSGILGVLVGPAMLKWLRIPEGKCFLYLVASADMLSAREYSKVDLLGPDDYVTRGVALGGNSSAIATALLLVSDPRAAALSSLSMSLFGTVMVALTSVPPIVRVVMKLVGREEG